jgi:hypothetical protein
VSALLSAPDEATALEMLHDLRCTDGLPVVVPTPARVDRAVLASGLDADLCLGEMGPMGGAATVEKVAACAVMAGCLPDHLPVVVAAVRAVIEPAFDLTEMQATTHGTAPLVIVNGPARHACGLASGFGALGPGHRANASIGRALRLAMINLGGGRPGESDMALLGHPAKFTYCLAEDEEHSPFRPLHVTRGFEAAQSVVTVIGAEPPHSVIHVGDADDPGSPERLLTALAAMLVAPGTNNAALGGGAAVVVLNPDHTAELASAGHTETTVASAVAERALTARGKPAFRDPADVLVVAAGGSGLYSAVMPSWCAGPHANRAVSVEVELGQACEVPWMVGSGLVDASTESAHPVPD